MNKILHSTKFLDFKSVKYDNDTKEWFYVHRPNASDIVVIVPVIKHKNKEDEILFLETKRPPLLAENIGEYSIELPAGLVGDERKNESILDAAKMELLEETGLVADEFKILLNKVSSSGGLTDEACTFLIALITDDKIKKEPQNDNGVIIKRTRVPISEVKDWIVNKSRHGFVVSSQTLAGLYLISS